MDLKRKGLDTVLLLLETGKGSITVPPTVSLPTGASGLRTADTVAPSRPSSGSVGRRSGTIKMNK